MKPSESTSYSLHQVGVTFSRNRGGASAALDRVDLHVHAGRRTALIGPSGCGKTTLLRVLAGLQPVSDGELLKSAESDRDVAFVFQQPALLPWRRVMKNVRLPLELGKRASQLNRVAATELALKALQDVDLAGHTDKFPHQLSGGMQMRVSIARALVTRPRTLLLDEPFAALDDSIRQQLGKLLTRLWNERRFTMVLVTHNIAEAITLSDRIVVLDSGRIFQEIENPLPTSTEFDVRRLPEFGGFYGQVMDIVQDAANQRQQVVA